MGFEIFYTVNCGLYLRSRDTAVLTDGLNVKLEGFSDTPEAVKTQLTERTGLFSRLDAALFTHCHPDHYSAELAAEVKRCPGPPAVWRPGAGDPELNLEERSPGVRVGRIGAIALTVIDTVHDGERFKDVPHASFLLQSEGASVFIAGDAGLGARESEILSGSAPIDTGFFMFYQLYSPTGRGFVRDMGFKNIVLYHLPMPGDDAFGYIRTAKRLVAHFPQDMPRPIIPEPMTWLHTLS